MKHIYVHINSSLCCFNEINKYLNKFDTLICVVQRYFYEVE